MNTGSKLAEYLLEIKAVKLSPAEPFTWSSGWKSPIYCDNRITLSYPHIRMFIKEELASLIKSKYPEAGAICGVATAGIAIGALVADSLNLPFSYCRPKPKEHGMKNQLEGEIRKGQQVVVIEDLISTGGSSLQVVRYLREQGYEIAGMAAIFTYEFDKATEAFESENCSVFTLGTYSDTIAMAAKNGYVEKSDLEQLALWREEPSMWNPVSQL